MDRNFFSEVGAQGVLVRKELLAGEAGAGWGPWQVGGWHVALRDWGTGTWLMWRDSQRSRLWLLSLGGWGGVPQSGGGEREWGISDQPTGQQGVEGGLCPRWRQGGVALTGDDLGQGNQRGSGSGRGCPGRWKEVWGPKAQVGGPLSFLSPRVLSPKHAVLLPLSLKQKEFQISAPRPLLLATVFTSPPGRAGVRV